MENTANIYGYILLTKNNKKVSLFFFLTKQYFFKCPVVILLAPHKPRPQATACGWQLRPEPPALNYRMFSCGLAQDPLVSHLPPSSVRRATSETGLLLRYPHPTSATTQLLLSMPYLWLPWTHTSVIQPGFSWISALSQTAWPYLCGHLPTFRYT